jgi:hypothetical protein
MTCVALRGGAAQGGGGRGEGAQGRPLRTSPVYLTWRSPILEKYTVESPYRTIVCQI